MREFCVGLCYYLPNVNSDRVRPRYAFRVLLVLLSPLHTVTENGDKLTIVASVDRSSILYSAMLIHCPCPVQSLLTSLIILATCNSFVPKCSLFVNFTLHVNRRLSTCLVKKGRIIASPLRFGGSYDVTI